MGILKHGLAVKSFGFVDVQEKYTISIEAHNVKDITVSMEDGQCSGVPWIKVSFWDVNKDVAGKTVLYNAATLEYIELA